MIHDKVCSKMKQAYEGGVRMTEFNNKDYIILKSISNASIPLGAHKILRALDEEGYSLSLSTVGRLLNDLENKELIQKEKKGRSVTEAGKQYISKFEIMNKSVSYHERIYGDTNNTNEKQLNDYFDARKMVEKEATALAIRNMTDDDLIKLINILNDEIETVEKITGDISMNDAIDAHAKLDYDFHILIIKASKNLHLMNFYEILGFSEKAQSLYALMVGVRLHGHSRIVKAFKERDVEAAVSAVDLHIEEVREETFKYINSKKLISKISH